jgi:hypothetical protein
METRCLGILCSALACASSFAATNAALTARVFLREIGQWTNSADLYEASIKLEGPHSTPLEQLKGRQFMMELANSHHVMAAVWLGDYYHIVSTMERDDLKAVQWYRIAAEAGNTHAQETLGWMFLNGGTNLRKDYEQSIHWFSMLYQHGEKSGMVGLASMYSRGLGVPLNLQEAERLYVQAEKFFGAASSAQDRIEKYKWWMVGSKIESNSIPPIDSIVMHMTRAEMEEGEKRAKAYMTKRYGSRLQAVGSTPH